MHRHSLNLTAHNRQHRGQLTVSLSEYSMALANALSERWRRYFVWGTDFLLPLAASGGD